MTGAAAVSEAAGGATPAPEVPARAPAPTVEDLRNGWRMIAHARIGEVPIHVVLIQPATGVVLLEIHPRWTPGALDLLRRRLEESGFAAARPGYLPIIHRRLRPQDVPHLDFILADAFVWQDRITLPADSGWEDALTELLAPGIRQKPAQPPAPPTGTALPLARRRVWRGRALAASAALAAGLAILALAQRDRWLPARQAPAGQAMASPAAPEPAAAPAPEPLAPPEAAPPPMALAALGPLPATAWSTQQGGSADAQPAEPIADSVPEPPPSAPPIVPAPAPAAVAPLPELPEPPDRLAPPPIRLADASVPGSLALAAPALRPPGEAPGLPSLPPALRTPPQAEPPSAPDGPRGLAAVPPLGGAAMVPEAPAAPLRLASVLATQPILPPATRPPAPPLDAMAQAPAASLAPGAPNPPAPAQPSPLSPSLDAMQRRGAEMLARGDISAARRLLEPAARAGSATAAQALAETYDPATLAERGVIGLPPDRAQALFWYRRAAALGAAVAPRIASLEAAP